MGTNEEYLDQLLQSVADEKNPATANQNVYSEDMSDDELLATLVGMYSDGLAEFKTEEIIHKNETEETEEVEELEKTVETVAKMEKEAEESQEIYAEIPSQTDFDEKESMMEEPSFSNDDFSNETEIADLLGGLNLDTDFDMPSEEVSISEEKDNNNNIDFGGNMSEESIADLFAMMNQNDEFSNIQAENTENADSDVLNEDSGETLEEQDILKDMGIDNMSEEQIDDLLSAASSQVVDAEPEMNLNDLFGGLNFADDFDPEHNTSADVADLLGGMMNNDDELAEINELLKKADSNEEVDSNLRNLLDTENDIGGNELLNELLQSDSDFNGNDPFGNSIEEKPKKKKEKKKKEKLPKEPKEKGTLWKKITDALFEEDEDLDDSKMPIPDADGVISIDVDDSNGDILEELMNGSGAAPKKKKEKNAKNKKVSDKGDDEGEEVVDLKEQAKLEKKKAKAEKQAAKKKAKEEKAEADKAFLKAQPSISTKRAMTAFLFAMSILGVILVIYNFVPDAIDKASARKAYYNKEYYKAYETLAGKELNDSDTILLEKVTCILKMQRKLDSYNNYVEMGKELEALNALVEGVKLYNECHTYATALSIDDEIDVIYEEIMIILSGKYGVDVQTVNEINACLDDAEYTLRLQYILDGKNWSIEEEPQMPMEDVLPEEEDFLEGQ